MNSLLIKNASLVDPSQGIQEKCNIFIENGAVKELFTKITEADAVFDADGLHAAPGLVDMHVHLRDPGQCDKEDIFSGCRAAAAGGVTSLLAMPNTVPCTDSAETVRYIIEKSKDADARVYVAASITKGLKSEECCDFRLLKNAGAIALTDDGRPVENTRLMMQAMQLAPSFPLTVLAHCEDLFLAHGGIINEGKVSEALRVNGIPSAAEDCGTARELALAESLGAPIHICHVSTETSVAMIRAAKKRGVKVTCETAPHYFIFTEEELLKRDADFRMNPPLRAERDRKAIITGLKDGTIDVIATDHAPHTQMQKSDFTLAPNGVIGMETSLAATLDALYRSGELTLMQIIDKMSTSPARILGINAGTLKEGSTADIVIFNPEEKWTVDTDNLHGKSKNTPFKGATLYGKVIATVLGGKIVYKMEE